MASLFLNLLLWWQVGQAVVLPTIEPDVFRLIYKADMKWNVVVTLLDERGRRRFQTEIKNSESFLLPINMSEENSGTFTVEMATPAYDLTETFEYVKYEDLVLEKLKLEYVADKEVLRLESTDPILKELRVYIYNQDGDQLILDEIDVSATKLMRIYNLKGAPARSFDVIVSMSGQSLIEARYDH